MPLSLISLVNLTFDLIDLGCRCFWNPSVRSELAAWKHIFLCSKPKGLGTTQMPRSGDYVQKNHGNYVGKTGVHSLQRFLHMIHDAHLCYEISYHDIS